MTVTVVAYDWNCPQHITPRYTLAELHELAGPLPGPLLGEHGQGACGVLGTEP